MEVFTVNTDPARIAARNRRRAGEIQTALQHAQRITGQSLLRRSIRMASGTRTTALLRAMGHPYSRRRSSPPGDPAIINAQTGRFRAAFKVQISTSSDDVKVYLLNTDPKAIWLFQGTRLMIARPLRVRVQQQEMPDWRRRLIEAYRAATR